MMRRNPVLILSLALAAASCNKEEPLVPLAEGAWRASLASPGGELPFGLELRREESDAARLNALVINGDERIELEGSLGGEGELVIEFPHYDARLDGRLSREGRLLRGTWSKALRSGGRSTLPLEARAGSAPRFGPRPDASADDAGLFAGRWSIVFDDEETPAVGVFEAREQGLVSGTILTATGDYRYLEGRADGRDLRLSTFDGAHAFLFHASLLDDGSLAGDFWSRDVYHASWVAVRDEDARLPDGFSMTAWDDAVGLGDLRFRTLAGDEVTLADPAFGGRARIIEVFGSWCPNCNDAIQTMVALHERYASEGLSVVGLAFEYSEDHEINARQVSRFAQRHGVGFPLLIAGKVDRERSHEMLPLLERIRAYPTTIFIDAQGRVRAVHTGFSGPATGGAYDELVAEFESLIQELLAEAGTAP